MGRRLRRAADLADPEMIVLFGAHARGEVNGRSTKSVHDNGLYTPDYEFLVILEQCKLARRLELWQTIMQRFRADPQSSNGVELSFLTKSRSEVNYQLRSGSAFFSDIKHQGIVLHRSEGIRLARCRFIDPIQRKIAARRALGWWYRSASDSLRAFELFVDRGRYRRAAFELHQAAEFLYTGVVIVFTGHQARSHNLRRLERRVSNLDPAFFGLLGQTTGNGDCRLFGLLNAAYVQGRYNGAFRVTRRELDELAAQVRRLQRVTNRICQERIKSYPK
jgi:HEPN domain-containing protein